MLFLENPFYILGVTPRAGEQEIRRMQEERRLFGEGERADRAAEMLLEPGARLCAELGWMPGVDESDARMLVSKFRWGDPADLEDFAGAARLNLLVWNIRRRRYGSAQERAADLMEAERILGKLSAREVASCISADRAQAGFPPAGEEEVSAATAGWRS